MRDYKRFFESLNQSETGKTLVDFLEDFCGKICDIRDMGTLTVEQRLELEKLIRKEIIDKIRLVNLPKRSDTNEYA